ncbi:MAG: Tetratricopeptide repeat protein [Firmicutes bacterium ADurb.Bin419]|nr:MAG: Tetratricopeptide repeat protein [Firmicutes bacterium ADurb.Bin419]
MRIEIDSEPQRTRKQVQHFISIGRFEKARSIASNLISEYPEYPYAYYDMAVCEFYLGRVDNSIELCQRALECGMKPLAVYIMMMIYHDEKGDYDSVDQYFSNINKISSGEADVLALYGYSLWKRGRKEEGIRFLDEAFSEECNNPIILRYVLLTSKRKKDKNQIKELMNIYMNTGASEKNKLMFLGKAEAYLGNWREAKKNYEKVVGIDPMNDEAKYFLNMMEVEEGIKKLCPFVFLLAVALFLKFSDGRIMKFFSLIPIILYLIFVAVFIHKKKSF